LGVDSVGNSRRSLRAQHRDKAIRRAVINPAGWTRRPISEALQFTNKSLEVSVRRIPPHELIIQMLHCTHRSKNFPGMRL
jgi:hypothetical protein